MKKVLYGNAIVGQSGGPTAAINATLSGVIRGALAHIGENGCIEKLYGMRNGIEGFMQRKTICLSDFFDEEEKLKLLEQTPAAALGSCRKKLPNPDSTDEKDVTFYRDLFSLLEEYNIRYFFYIGGNDSMDTVSKMSRYAKKCGYEIRIMGVPKTVDNDLQLTDHTPGYGSAAKFVATLMQEIIRDCAVYQTKAVTIVEVMGRDAGWLTAAAAIGRVAGCDAPDLVYLPERAFDMEQFFSRIEERFAVHPNLVVAVSEGIRFADGRYVGEGRKGGAVDAFGHAALSGAGKVLEQAVKERFGCKVRSIELNLPQRCAGHLLSLTDITESVRIGRAAVDAAADGVTGSVMIFQREAGEEYRCNVRHANVSEIANMVKNVPDEFINEAGDNVTDSCCEYLLPLIAGECDVLFKNGLPRHIVL